MARFWWTGAERSGGSVQPDATIRATFDTWLRGSQVVRIDGGTMTVKVRNTYAVDWLEARWSTPIQRTGTGIVGQDLAVEFVAGDDDGET